MAPAARASAAITKSVQAERTGIALLLSKVSLLNGVGAAGELLLKKLLRQVPNPLDAAEADPLPCVRDLLFHAPVDVMTRVLSPSLAEVEGGTRATFVAQVVEHLPGSPGGRGQRRPYRILCSDGESEVQLVFFHAGAEQLRRQFPVGERLVIGGRAERYHGILQVAHPDIVRPEAELAQVLLPEPVYPLTEGLTPNRLHKWMLTALGKLGALPEWLDGETITRAGWPSFPQAMEAFHHPAERSDLEAATPVRTRFAYDEALASQIALLLVRRFEGKYAAPRFALNGPLVTRQLSRLPFRLTRGQQQVLKDIAGDLASGHGMLRLLQGDVGSGKTVVAFLSMLAAIDGGTQAAIMAPTAILALQHYKQFKAWGEALGIHVVHLAGQQKERERRELLASIASGEAHMVVGTHALFQKGVSFANLGMAVIDEQHRFGVLQRMALASKGGEAAGSQGATHLLLMTATPIPRSLTLTLYGDLDSSLLKEKPAGRKPIITRAVPLAREAEVIERLSDSLAKGARVYWICPLVGDEASPTDSDFQAAILRYKQLNQIFPGLVGLVHGRMKSADRDTEMLAFAEGRSRILVATTVIEVGIDVPEASVIVIENAERFGLAQLHQLRGRVGRGETASSCLLLYGEPLSATAKERLHALRDNDDGFIIAEEDLRLRGGGDLLGVRQSGLPEFRFVDLARHADLIRQARQEASYYLERDPQLKEPRGRALIGLLHLFGYDRMVNLIRSG